MLVGLILLVAGVIALGYSGTKTKRLVEERWGYMDEQTMALSKGNGTVPTWVSVLGLVGWVGIGLGAITMIASCVAG